MSGDIVSYRYDGDSSSLYQALIKTLKYLEELAPEEVKVSSHFEAWYNHRKVTIKTIEELQKKINNICVGANVVRGVGAVAGLASFFAGIVGVVLEAKGHESADNFKQFGKYCGGASIAAVASSTLLELGVSQSFMNEIERVLEKDIELTKPLEKWVEFSRKVNLLVEEHFHCSITSSIFPKIMEVVGYCIQALEAGQKENDRLIREIKSCKIKCAGGDMIEVIPEVAQLVEDFLKRMYENPQLRDALRSIWKNFKETPHVFEFAKLGSMIYYTVYRALNSSRLSFLLSLAGIACPEFGNTFVRCAFDAVTIGTNVISLILAAQNIKEGKSKYSDALDDIKNALRSELDEVSSRMTMRARYILHKSFSVIPEPQAILDY